MGSGSEYIVLAIANHQAFASFDAVDREQVADDLRLRLSPAVHLATNHAYEEVA